MALSDFMGPTILGPGIGYSHISQSIIPCFHCVNYLVVLIIVVQRNLKGYNYSTTAFKLRGSPYTARVINPRMD